MSLLVLGIGNVLMGDEGVGVHVVRRLHDAPLPNDVTVIDGGTGGLHLLSCFHDFDQLIVVDASADGRPPGTVTELTPKYASDFPRSLTAHDIGLRDVIEAASLLRPLPPTALITVSVAGPGALGLTLSPSVDAAVSDAVAAVRRHIAHAAEPALSAR